MSHGPPCPEASSAAALLSSNPSTQLFPRPPAPCLSHTSTHCHSGFLLKTVLPELVTRFHVSLLESWSREKVQVPKTETAF